MFAQHLQQDVDMFVTGIIECSKTCPINVAYSCTALPKVNPTVRVKGEQAKALYK
jgi:hypothetical protein